MGLRLYASLLVKYARNAVWTTFALRRYFENGRELMANGVIRIDRGPQSFESPCSFHVRFESGKIAAFQLLLDTYALQKFRGEMD